MFIGKRIRLMIACSLLIAAQTSSKEKPKPAPPVPAQAAAPAEGTPAPETKTMSCKGCKAATDSLKAAREAAREALGTEDKDKLKAALQRADAQMAKMEGHKEKCMSMMKDAGKTDSAAAPETGAHDKH